MWLVKTDSMGSIEWEQTYGYGGAKCRSLKQTSDGGYILGGHDLGGYGNADVYCVKTDSMGEFQWEFFTGTENWDACWSILQSNDGGFLGGGVSNGHTYIFKLDSTGMLAWDNYYSQGAQNSECYSIVATTDGCYALGGWHEYNSSQTDKCYQLIRLSGPPPPWVTLSPINPPLQIPPNGGSFQFDITVANQNAAPTTVDVWTMVTLPDSSLYGPVLLRQNIPLSAGQSISRTLTQSVPAGVPAGIYYYKAIAGNYLFGIEFGDDWFAFEKLAGGLYTSDDDWIVSGWAENAVDIIQTPDNIALIGAHPNPFNPTTTISFDLPAASRVKLDVFDINGRNVGARHAVPSGRHKTDPYADTYYSPGSHSIIFDGSGLASGIYIYHLTVDEMSGSGPEGGLRSTTPTMMTGKMVLMK